MKSNSGISRIFILLALALIGCYEPEEGCLDATATNFAVAADVACDGCCVYPQLKLAFRHRAGLTNPDTLVPFSYDSTYTVDGFPGVPVRFQRIKYYLSNFKLVNGTESIGVEGEITLTGFFSGESFTVADNFALVDRNIFTNNTLGLFRNPGTYDGVQFTVGLEEDVQDADPALVPGTHPLSIQTDSLNWEEEFGYIPNKVVFFRDTTAGTDSTVVRTFTPVDVFLPAEEPFEIEGGFDIVVTLQVDYLSWFSGVDLSSATIAEIQSTIVNNLTNSFELSAVRLE